MPIAYARRLAGRDRTAAGNRHLGFALAFVAGATNAGGFLAVHQYTSHMTGIVSSMVDNLVLGSFDVVFGAAAALASFVLGAMCSAILVNYARQRRLSSEYAIPLLLEASLLLCFGLMGASLAKLPGLFVPATVMLLCFIMGLQNAVISKMSKAEIRTTHITGTVTDIGIELGKLIYWNSPGTPLAERVEPNRARLLMLISLATSFVVGGLAGAVGFKHIGYLSTVPLALMVATLAIVPAIDDAGATLRKWLGDKSRVA